MTTDWRTLCVELVDEFEGWIAYGDEIDIANAHVLIDRARAALAEPEPEGPTYDDLSDLCSQHGLDVDSWPLEKFDTFWEITRAVLARWGTPNLTGTRSSLKDAWAAHQPAIEAAAKAGMEACRMDGPAVPDSREPASVIEKPSDGEVAELVRKLREQAAAYSAYPDHAPLIEEWARCFTRAADLLEQRQSVPVAGWQPIDTAPKDGTEILASDYDAIEIVSWVEHQEWKTWYWTGRDGQVMHPAWWQPLLDHPPIPTTEAQP